MVYSNVHSWYNLLLHWAEMIKSAVRQSNKKMSAQVFKSNDTGHS